MTFSILNILEEIVKFDLVDCVTAIQLRSKELGRMLRQDCEVAFQNDDSTINFVPIHEVLYFEDEQQDDEMLVLTHPKITKKTKLAFRMKGTEVFAEV